METPFCPDCKKPLNECICESIECKICNEFPCICIEKPDSLDIAVEITKCTVQLSKDQGEQIKDLIQENYHYSFPSYCAKVGISPPNFYNVVNGDRSCSLEFLNKLLSGIRFEAVILNPEIHIQEITEMEIQGNENDEIARQ